MSPSIEDLAKMFSRLPGIGERQAKRFVYFLLLSSQSYRSDLARRINEINKNVSECSMCSRIYENGYSSEKVCEICANPARDASSILIVEKDPDIAVLEGSDVYRGLYFVLGGLVKLPDEGKHNIRLEKLIARIKKAKGIKEIILALPANPHGEYTDRVLRAEIGKLDTAIKVTTFGRGLSSGSEIEYADAETLKNALTGRH